MDQIGFSFGILAVIAICFLSAGNVGMRIIEPGKLMLVGWIPGFALLASGAIMYQQDFSLLAFAVIALSLILFTVGAMIGTVMAKSRLSGHPARKEISSPDTPVLSIIGALSLLYIVLAGYDLLTSPLSFLRVGFSGIGELRQAHWTNAGDADVGIYGFAKSIGRTSVILLVMMAMLRGRKVNTLLLGLALVGGAMLILEGLSKGGRSYLGFALLFAAMGGALPYFSTAAAPNGRIVGRLARLPIRWYHLALGGVFAFFSFVIFPAMRNANLEGQLLRHLNYRHPSEFGAWVELLSSSIGAGWLKMFVFGSGYFSHSITKLVYFITESDVPGYGLMGFFNAKFFVRIASIMDESLFRDWLGIRERLANGLQWMGYTTNPWATLLRDLIIDFGFIGTPIAMFIFGLLSQYGFRRLMATRRAECMALAGVICICTAVSGSFGPFVNNMISYPLFFMGLVLLANETLRSLSSRARLRHT